MTKGLATLIRLHRWQVDERRRRLGELTRRAEDLHDRARRLEREIADEQARARQDPLEAGTAYARYARTAIDRRSRIGKAIDHAEAEVAAARDELAEAYRSLRTLELAEAERQRRQTLEAARREQIDLDEVGIQGHRRRQNTGSLA